MGSCSFGIILPINEPKCHRGKFYLLWIKKLSKLSEFYYLEPGLYLPIMDFVEIINTLIQERHNRRSCITVKVSRRTQKVEITLANEGSGPAFFLVQTWDAFSAAMLAMTLEWCWEKKDLTNQRLHTTLSTYTVSWFTRTWLSKISLATRTPLCWVAYFSIRNSKLETL